MKKALTVLTLILLLSVFGFTQNLATVINALGARESTLTIFKQYAVTDDLTIPDNITLEFLQGGSVLISTTKTLTINGHVEAGLYTIFEWAGTGKVDFGLGSVSMVYPEWWGAVPYDAGTPIDCAAALQAATDTGLPVIFSALYESRSTITFDNAYCQVTYIGNARVGRTDTFTHHDSGIYFTDDSIPGIVIDFTTVAGVRRAVIKNINILGSDGVDVNHSGIVIPEGRIANFILEECRISHWGKHDVLIQGGTGIVELRRNGFGKCANDYAIMLSDSAIGGVPPPDVIIDGGYCQGICAGGIAIDNTAEGVGNHITIMNFNIELQDNATKPLIYIKNAYGVHLSSIIMSTTVATVAPDDAMIVLDGNLRSATLENIQCYAQGGLNNVLINAGVLGVNIIGGFYGNSGGMGAGLGYFVYNKGTNVRLFVSYPAFGTFTAGKNIVYNDGVTPRMFILSAEKCGYMNSGAGFGFGTLTPSVHADITLEDGELCMKETTTPTADAGYGKIYTKANDLLYFQDGAGVEHKSFSSQTPTKLTVAGGAITVTKNYHMVDGQGDANDDLDTISGFVDGMILILQAEDDAVTITIRDNSVGGGNIETKENASIILDDVEDKAYVFYDATNSTWTEIGRTNFGLVTKKMYLNNAAFTKGGTAPTQVILGNLNGWEFDIGDDAVMTRMIQPDWAVGTLLTIKICWYIDEAYVADKEIQWRVDWSALPHDFSEAVDAPTHSGQIDSGVINIPAVAKRMGTSTIGTIAGASLSAGDMLGFTLSRIAVAGDDPTAKPTAHHLIIEYTSDKMGAEI